MVALLNILVLLCGVTVCDVIDTSFCTFDERNNEIPQIESRRNIEKI